MATITRRRFVQSGLASGVVLGWQGAVGTSHARTATGGQLAKYLEPVPRPGAGIVVATPSGANAYTFTQREIQRRLHPHLPPTPLWAYDDGSGLAGQAGSFGMAVVAHSGTPLTMRFRPARANPAIDQSPRHHAEALRIKIAEIDHVHGHVMILS